MNAPDAAVDVVCVGDIEPAAINSLAKQFGLNVNRVLDGEDIPGSYWGNPEAGIKGLSIFVRSDTPIHSMLHELSHVVCASAERRKLLDKDAGSDDHEESAVCYLQILLADLIPGVGRARLMQDMDCWGYSFRLGDTATWFGLDADDARKWLVRYGLIDIFDKPLFRLRES